MQKISDPKQIKNLDFSRRKVAGILSYFKTDNDEKADFLLFGRVRILTHLLRQWRFELALPVDYVTNDFWHTFKSEL